MTSTAPAPTAVPSPAPPSELDGRLAAMLRAVDAPDVVVAVSVRGRRTVVSGGTAPEPTVPRTGQRYELGSLTKTFTCLLACEMAARGVIGLDDPVADYLPTGNRRAPGMSLRHLMTHTSGLPRIPRDLVLGALTRPHHNPYTGYSDARLLRAFSGTRLRSAPGRRWHYSNFGMALLGRALAEAAGKPYDALLDERVLRPLGLADTAADLGRADVPGDAVGRAGDGTTVVPSTGMGAFAPAGAVRATPGDLLAYAEAHLRPDATPLAEALRSACAPQLEHGWPRRSGQTLGWIRHPAEHGPLLFHPGATFGQQAYAGFHPPTGTALVALATRRGRSCRVVQAAYELLYALAESGERVARSR